MVASLIAAAVASSPVYEASFRPTGPFGLNLVAREASAKLLAEKKEGVWEVWLEAEHDGNSLIGADKRFAPDRYRHRLDGRYSIIAREPDGRLKLVHDRVGGVLRGFWGFQATIAGVKKKGWMELAPLPMPQLSGAKVSAAAPAQGRVSQRSLPTQDKSDRTTGFRAILRPYHWSGVDGKAWVISFDKRMPWSGHDVKLVFPEKAAWVPGFQLSPRHMVQFEFIETWGGGAKGCYEPMSDRVDRFGRVELVEDSPRRKVLRWTYQLANPDYVRWGENAGGRQSPEVEELWTVFPDGLCIRRQRYWPCLDSTLEQHVLGCQVAELDVVWAADTIPSDATPDDAATVFSPGKSFTIRYPSQRQPGDPKFGGEPAFGIAVHSLDSTLPDVFAAFGQEGSTNPPYQISVDDGPDWHRERLWRFCHFPFNEEPFMYETNSQTEGRGQISHSSLVYVGAPEDRHWQAKFRVDPRGRKYREWVSVVGLAKPRDFDGMLAAREDALKRR